MPDITFPSLSGGEIAPAYYGRTDQDSYFISAKALYNTIASQTGPGVGRGGTMYVATTKDGGKVLLVPFQFNEEQAYILEFGEGYMRVYRNRAQVSEDALTITGATQANPVVLTVNHSLPPDRTVLIAGVVGMTQLNGNYYLTESVLAAAKNISAATRTNPVRITLDAAHGYVGGELVFIEAVGGMTELNDRTFELVAVINAEYTITDITQANPAVVTVTGVHGLIDGDVTLIRNVVGMTQLNNRRFVISPVYSATVNVSAVTKANPGVVTTATPHGFNHGDFVLLENLGGMTQLNDREFQIGRSIQSAKTLNWIYEAANGKLGIHTTAAHGYSTGHRVYFTGVGHAVELNGNEYTITVIDTTNFELDGTNHADFTKGPPHIGGP